MDHTKILIVCGLRKPQRLECACRKLSAAVQNHHFQLQPIIFGYISANIFGDFQRGPKLPIFAMYKESKPGQHSHTLELARVPWEISVFLKKPDQIGEFCQKISDQSCLGDRGRKRVFLTKIPIQSGLLKNHKVSQGPSTRLGEEHEPLLPGADLPSTIKLHFLMSAA